MTEVICGRRYRHFKGNIYTVICVGKNTETMEDMVVYRDDAHIWIRPLAMFIQPKEVNGKMIDRFTLLENEE